LTALPNGAGLVFHADDGSGPFSSNKELWFTDGTMAGTRKFPIAPPNTNGSYPERFTALPDGSGVVFTADSTGTGSNVELWRFNVEVPITAPGTGLVLR
jgi:ELWxxDGT repeat protein